MTVAPLFTMLTEQRFCVVSFIKKKKRKRSHYFGQSAPFEENWSVFTGDLPTHSHLPWSIFMGDLPTHIQSGLFS
jgi:hypothetical protein